MPSHWDVFRFVDDGSTYNGLVFGRDYSISCVGSNCASSLEFDGGNFVSFPPVNPSGDMTYEAWVYEADDGDGLEVMGGTGNGAVGYVFNIYNTPGHIYVSSDGSVDNEQAYWTLDDDGFDPSILYESWHHLALTRSGTRVELFVDGTSYGPKTLHSVAHVEWIGRGANGNFTGKIDEVRISDVVRYVGGFNPCETQHFASDAHTVALWHMDEGTGEMTADASGHGHDAILEGSPLPQWTENFSCGEELLMSGGSSRFGTSTSSSTLSNYSSSSPSMTITDTLGRVWRLQD